MGLRGPLPKSRAERKLTGNASRRPLPKAGEQHESSVEKLQCPDFVSPDAKAYWEKVVPLLIEEGTVDERDWSALVILCEAWGDFVDAVRTLKKEGQYYETANGAKCPHPALKLKSQAQRMVNGFLEKFGLQPTTRARLPVIVAPAVADKDSYAEFREES